MGFFWRTKKLGQFLAEYQIRKCCWKTYLGYTLPCNDNEFMHETHQRWGVRKLVAHNENVAWCTKKGLPSPTMHSHNMAVATLVRTAGSSIMASNWSSTDGQYLVTTKNLGSECRTALNTITSGRFLGFSCQNNQIALHVALRVHNSGAKSGRELLKGSKDVASLLVCTQKKFLVGDTDILWVTSQVADF